MVVSRTVLEFRSYTAKITNLLIEMKTPNTVTYSYLMYIAAIFLLFSG